MALTPYAHKALQQYCDRAGAQGPENRTILEAVKLTVTQRQALNEALTKRWGRTYLSPMILDIKPRHGYESRVLKDGFSAEKYVEWLVLGCSDVAVVDVGTDDRIRLAVKGITDETRVSYDIHVLISSDAHGKVHIFDVIPRGLPPRQKKTAPSAIP